MFSAVRCYRRIAFAVFIVPALSFALQGGGQFDSPLPQAIAATPTPKPEAFPTLTPAGGVVSSARSAPTRILAKYGHQSNVLLTSAVTIGDHFVEYAGGQTFIVRLINPIVYDKPLVQDNVTTNVTSTSGVLPSITSIIPAGPADVLLDKQISDLIMLGTYCDTKAHCEPLIDDERQAIKLLTYSDVKDNIDLLEYALQIPFVLNTAAQDYQDAALQIATDTNADTGTANVEFTPDMANCLSEIQKVVGWVDFPGPAFPKPAAGKSSCASYAQNAPPIPTHPAYSYPLNVPASRVFVLTGKISTIVQLLGNIRDLETQIESAKTQNFPQADKEAATKELQALEAGVRKNVTIPPELEAFYSSGNGTDGEVAAAAAAAWASLAPFRDLNPQATYYGYDVACNNFAVDGQSNALTFSAVNRYTLNVAPAASPGGNGNSSPSTTIATLGGTSLTAPTLAVTTTFPQSVGTVDCPAALTLHAGAGISTIPVNTFQLSTTSFSTNSMGQPQANYTVTGSTRREQLIGAAFTSFCPVSLGGGAQALCATIGVGAVSSSFNGLAGFSLSFARRLFLNVAWQFGSITTIPPGILGQNVPSGYMVPTGTASTTKITFTLSLGGSPAASTSAPNGGSQSGPAGKPGH